MRNLYLPIVLFSFLALGACSSDDEEDMPEPGLSLPASISGMTFDLECSFANPNAPYALGHEADFTFGTDGSLSIDFDPSAANGPDLNVSNGQQIDNEFVWEDSQGGYKYALSLRADDSLNEVNVFDLQDNFLNQWTPKISGTANLSLLRDLAGSYTVQSVNGGSHSRGTFIINADGSIDFDSGISFSISDYASISDRLEVLDAIFVDMLPWPDEPYPRLELMVDPNDPSVLVQVIYRDTYPNVGAIELNF